VSRLTLGNREFIFTCIKLLTDQDKISDDDLYVLTDAKSCKEKFNCVFPILLEIFEESNREDLSSYYGLGIKKYYVEQANINGRFFLVTNQWYNANKNNPNNKSPFLSWMLSKLS
jgi:hypothetical protein